MDPVTQLEDAVKDKAKPLDPRVRKINEAWLEGHEMILGVLLKKWAARWIVSAKMRLASPRVEDYPATHTAEVILFTRQKDQVWGSLNGLRLMVADGVQWVPAP